MATATSKVASHGEGPSRGPSAGQGVRTTALVKAEAGGALVAPDGAKLQIPAGALTSDTLITVSQHEEQTPPSATLVYHLEPSGLSLSKPAALTIPYRDLPFGESQMQVWVSTALAPLRKAGAEQTNWERGVVVGRDEALNTRPSR